MNLGKFLPKAWRDYAAALDYQRALEGQDEACVAEMQLSKLRVVWRDAVADVPHYGRLVREGRAPAEIVTWDDFRAIPELTREILQDRAEEFVRVSGPPDLTRMTGGSTGNPVKFGVWHAEDEVIRMLKLVLWARAGYRPGDRLFLIWGHGHLLGTGWRRHWNHFLRKGKDAVLGYRRVDAYAMNPELCRDYAEQLLRYRPAGLVGYSAVLDYFVRALPEYGERFAGLGLKFVMPCAEPAPRPDSFALLAQTFGCPVIQEFGGVDFGQVAMKFGADPFEVFAEYNVLEGGGPEETSGKVEKFEGGKVEAEVRSEELGVAGGEGGPVLQSFGVSVIRSGRRSQTEGGEEAVVTALYRRYLPLIRYRQGDVLGGCRKLENGHVTYFERLEGRVNDMVELADGTSVHSVAVFHCIHQEPGVLNIQMVLEDAGPRILLAKGEGYGAATEARIRQRLAQISPLLQAAPIEGVVDVESSRAGKRRWFVDKRNRCSS
jgi:phenylacetate-coenzyme A ligase PaaK-like adenylate-forming protein